jgi:hypothetical protein
MISLTASIFPGGLSTVTPFSAAIEYSSCLRIYDTLLALGENTDLALYTFTNSNADTGISVLPVNSI